MWIVVLCLLEYLALALQYGNVKLAFKSITSQVFRPLHVMSTISKTQVAVYEEHFKSLTSEILWRLLC